MFIHRCIPKAFVFDFLCAISLPDTSTTLGLMQDCDCSRNSHTDESKGMAEMVLFHKRMSSSLIKTKADLYCFIAQSPHYYIL